MASDCDSAARGHAQDGLDARLIPDEAALHVGVAEEPDARFQVAEGFTGLAGGDHVLVLVEGRAVEELEGVHGDRAARQRSRYERGILAGQVLQGPQGGAAGHGVEPLQIVLAGGGAVVIAAHDDGAVGAHPIADGVGIGAVADQIAAAQGAIVMAGGSLEDGIEGFEIGVKVTDYEIAHGESG